MARAAGLADCGVAQVVPLLRVQHLGDRRFDYVIPEGLQIKCASGPWWASASVRGTSAGSWWALPDRPPMEAGELRAPRVGGAADDP